MNTLLDLAQEFVESQEPEIVEAEQPVQVARDGRFSAGALPWSPEAFAHGQVRGLVSQVFLAAGPKPVRQVLFVPVDAGTQTGELCLRVSEQLAESVSGTVCMVSLMSDSLAGGFSGVHCGDASASRQKRAGDLRDLAQQVSSNLWFMPAEVFTGHREDAFSPVFLRARLAEMRLEFDYTVLQGPSAATCCEAAVVGGLCDGAVLVLEANVTRRLTAQRVKERLHAANVRLFGTVLTERKFPIPRALYNRV